MRIGNKEIKGRQGVWLVDVLWDDGRKATLPTAHHKDAIVKHGAVVMTDDNWIGDTPKRIGYSDVFAITDLQLEDHGSNHSFTVTRWL